MHPGQGGLAYWGCNKTMNYNLLYDFTLLWATFLLIICQTFLFLNDEVNHNGKVLLTSRNYAIKFEEWLLLWSVLWQPQQLIFFSALIRCKNIWFVNVKFICLKTMDEALWKTVVHIVVLDELFMFLQKLKYFPTFRHMNIVS